MGYQVYERSGRDCGYGVPAICDHPGCGAEIDRGLAYCCGGGPDKTCCRFFCGDHLNSDGLCARCVAEEDPFDPTPDTQEWIKHKETDESWAEWRALSGPAAGGVEQ